MITSITSANVQPTLLGTVQIASIHAGCHLSSQTEDVRALLELSSMRTLAPQLLTALQAQSGLTTAAKILLASLDTFGTVAAASNSFLIVLLTLIGTA